MSSVSIVSLVSSMPLAFAATTGSADIANLQPTKEVEERIYRPCKRLTDEEKLKRCLSRQLSNWRQGQYVLNQRRAAAADAANADNNIRAKLVEQRRKAFEEKLKTRETYRQTDKSKDDQNTERVPYLKWLREERYRCLTETRPGRERNQCFDVMENEARKRMEEIERGKAIPGVPNSTSTDTTTAQ